MTQARRAHSSTLPQKTTKKVPAPQITFQNSGVCSTGAERALHSPSSLTPQDVIHLQRIIGNQAVSRLIAPPAPSTPTKTHLPGSAGIVQRLVLPLGAPPEGTKRTPDNAHAYIIRDGTEAIKAASGEANIEPGHTEVDMDAPQPLADLDSGETLYITAHGSIQAVDHFTPKQLAQELVGMGLPDNYGGCIDLVACLSGLPDKKGESYAYRFQKALYKLGILVTVKGLKGYGKIVKNKEGDDEIRALPPENEEEFDLEHERLLEEIRSVMDDQESYKRALQEYIKVSSDIAELEIKGDLSKKELKELQRLRSIKEDDECLIEMYSQRDFDKEIRKIHKKSFPLIDQYHYASGEGVDEINPSNKQLKKFKMKAKSTKSTRKSLRKKYQKSHASRINTTSIPTRDFTFSGETSSYDLDDFLNDS